MKIMRKQIEYKYLGRYYLRNFEMLGRTARRDHMGRNDDMDPFKLQGIYIYVPR